MTKHPVKQLIEQGEHDRLDFKFEISDAAKIARSLVAFANTVGGRLLIGVKDNGAIAGIRSEEEYYMAEMAATMYCRPEVPIKSKEWVVEGRKILEVSVAPGASRPYKAPDTEGRYKAYVRVADENILAPGIQMKVWQKEQRPDGVVMVYDDQVKGLLSLFENNGNYSLRALKEASGLKKHDLEHLLSDLILLQAVSMTYQSNEPLFRLHP